MTVDLTVNAGSSDAYLSHPAVTLTFQANPFPAFEATGWWSPELLHNVPGGPPFFPPDIHYYYRYQMVPCFGLLIWVRLGDNVANPFVQMTNSYFMDPTAAGNSCDPVSLTAGTKLITADGGYILFQSLNVTVVG